MGFTGPRAWGECAINPKEVSGGKAAHTVAAPPARRPCRLDCLDGAVQPKRDKLKGAHACSMWQGWRRSGWNTVNTWQGAPGPKSACDTLSTGSAASSVVGCCGRGCCPHTSLQCKCSVGFAQSLPALPAYQWPARRGRPNCPAALAGPQSRLRQAAGEGAAAVSGLTHNGTCPPLQRHPGPLRATQMFKNAYNQLDRSSPATKPSCTHVST